MYGNTNRQFQDSIKNDAKGTVWYGLHFYSGLAEYQEPDKDPYRVYLNENTLRAMDPSFAGRPVFVQHVDGVDENLDSLRNEADGWVVESFYNESDGKHWVKFLVCSEEGESAIRKGWQLSNCYIPKTFSNGGLWNGIAYTKEITGGEYEHLAIVPNPRYEESVIMNPEQFKKYNEDKKVELKRLSNERKEPGMLKFFKKTKVENAIDLESMSVVLPKSGREVSITKLVNEMDEHEEKKKDTNSGMADLDHKVKMHDSTYCNVAELVEKHKALHDELEGMKSKKEDAVEMPEEEKEEKEEKPKNDDEGTENEEDKSDVKKNLKLDEHEEKEVKDAKQKNAMLKAERLRNANFERAAPVSIELSSDKIARGKSRYGS